MGASKRPSTDLGVELQPEGGHGLDHRRPLHVPELTPVVVAVDLDARGPAEEDVGNSLHEPLPFDDPLTWSGIAASRQMCFENRARSLLDLEEQRVSAVAALQQHHERSGSDAADAHDLAGGVDDSEPREQLP